MNLPNLKISKPTDYKKNDTSLLKQKISKKKLKLIGQFGVDMVHVPGVVDQSAFLSESFLAYRTSERFHVAALVL